MVGDVAGHGRATLAGHVHQQAVLGQGRHLRAPSQQKREKMTRVVGKDAKNVRKRCQEC
jgi:hypothetical protein